MDSYQLLSTKVYNFDKPIGASFGDIEFYESCLNQLSTKSLILEPADGTGRLMIPTGTFLLNAVTINSQSIILIPLPHL